MTPEQIAADKAPSLKPPSVWFHFVTNETGAQTNIRKWSHAPFEGAVEYVLASTPAPASDDAMSVWKSSFEVWINADPDEDKARAALIIQQYGDQREAAGFRRAVEAAAKVAEELAGYWAKEAAGGFSGNPVKYATAKHTERQFLAVAARIAALLETQEAG